MKVEIFSTPMCVKCNLLKKELTEGDYTFDIEIVDASTPEGLRKAKEKKITFVPTVYIYDDEGKELGVAHDIDEIENLIGK